MTNELTYIGEKMRNHQQVLSERVEKLEAKEGRACNNVRLKNKRQELFYYLGMRLSGELQEDSGLTEVKEWAAEVGEIALNEGIDLDKLLQMFSVMRRAMWDVFAEEIEKENFAPSTIYEVNRTAGPLLDDVFIHISQVYMNLHQKDWAHAQAKLVELAAPVVPVTEEIAVLTVVGEIDSHRAQIIMERSLSQATELELSYLLIDVSGVPMIDTSVAHNIFQVIQALELVGVETTLTGLRPEIARAVVEMGIEFDQTRTKATVKQALSEIGFVYTKKNRSEGIKSGHQTLQKNR